MKKNILDIPILHKTTRSHLVYQIFYRYIPFIWILLPTTIIYISQQVYAGTIFYLIFLKFSLISTSIIFSLLDREFQAILLFISVKITQAIVSVLILTVGLYFSYPQNNHFFYAYLLLGLSILPGPEYFKRYLKNHKPITSTRLLIFSLAVWMFLK
jgi:hypothetical protein